MCFTTSQCAGLGFEVKWDMVWTANTMSGWVPRVAYINEPTTSWYGMSHIWADSAIVDGDWEDEKHLSPWGSKQASALQGCIDRGSNLCKSIAKDEWCISHSPDIFWCLIASVVHPGLWCPHPGLFTHLSVLTLLLLSCSHPCAPSLQSTLCHLDERKQPDQHHTRRT